MTSRYQVAIGAAGCLPDHVLEVEGLESALEEVRFQLEEPEGLEEVERATLEEVRGGLERYGYAEVWLERGDYGASTYWVQVERVLEEVTA